VSSIRPGVGVIYVVYSWRILIYMSFPFPFGLVSEGMDKIRQRGREYFHETLSSSSEGRAAFAVTDIANKGIDIDHVSWPLSV